MKRLDWNEYHGYIDQLANQINTITQDNKYKHLYAVDCDDMIVAAHLSFKLDIPLVSDISLLTFLLNMGTDQHDTLLVSNVVKTGTTFKSVMEQCESELDTAVLFKDPACKFTPTYLVDVPDKFIIFPWEDK